MLAEETTTTTQRHLTEMASSSSLNISHKTKPIPIIFTHVCFLLLIVTPAVLSLPTNQSFKPMEELQKLRRIRAHLRKINKPSVKTIQSPDGDVIECVLSHLQPAFDHPQLKGQKPLEPPERPKVSNFTDVTMETYQLWASSNEFCPEGTIPIRRTTEKDILRASSIRKFGRKIRRGVRHDTLSDDHEVSAQQTPFKALSPRNYKLMKKKNPLWVLKFFAFSLFISFRVMYGSSMVGVAFVNGEQYYGAKASMNVWTPRVTDQYEFSLSQLWVISGSFGNDLNTIEAGWQVSPELYGDGYPRFFTYWTTDAYQATGCYNLLCSGFVQTNNKIAIGATISPRSSYIGKQFDIGIMIWKDPKHGHWWLEFGNGLLIGYWPSFLFSHLQTHASMIQFGGEIVNSRLMGYHTSTQMGSGHFADEGYKKASYFRNLQLIDWDNNLLPLSNLHLLADHPNCYDIKAGKNNVWGNYIYYGGPGRNARCP